MAMAKMSPDWSSRDSSQELHVLAVDDSLVYRKVIERLLKISCCKMTAVESGRRALQYLGLDGEKNSFGFDVSEELANLVVCLASLAFAVHRFMVMTNMVQKFIKSDELKINLIMTDYSLPGMTGFELLQKIKLSIATIAVAIANSVANRCYGAIEPIATLRAGSSKLKEIPVVIMSSENILARADRYHFVAFLASICGNSTSFISLLPLDPDNSISSRIPSVSISCDSLVSSPMLVSVETHMFLANRPSLVAASD
ncbi:hypothetical protein OROGR_029371 [Orobanche gracilis]